MKEELKQAVMNAGMMYLAHKYTGTKLKDRISLALQNEVNYAIVSDDSDRIVEAKKRRSEWQAYLAKNLK